jgi:aldose 1-epimerase
MRKQIVLAAAALLTLAACKSTDPGVKGSVTKQEFGKTAKGEAVDLYVLKNKNGVEAAITTYGGIVAWLKTADKQGLLANIALGFYNLDGYLKEPPYFGALIGRYGNRIAKGKFTLDGKQYTLAKNNGENSLHGGIRGFDKQLWTAEPKSTPDSQGLLLKYTSKDGEEGYPGTLDVTVTYTLDDNDEMSIHYRARTDKTTVLNLTNHTYFNLAGEGKGDILEHSMTINAGRFTPVDAGLIPTGELKSVEGTPFDFRKPFPIGARINASHEQLKLGRGYDHNYALDRSGPGLELAARASEAATGRVLEVWTTEPGVQFYTGNFLDGTIIGASNSPYGHRSGFCLETQHYPDAPNQPVFPTTVLKPGEEYRSSTVWKFRILGVNPH